MARFGTFGGFWGLSGTFWSVLARSGMFWCVLARSGAFWRGTNDNNNNNNNNANSGGRGPWEIRFSYYAVWGAQGQEKRRPKHKCCGKNKHLIWILLVSFDLHTIG